MPMTDEESGQLLRELTSPDNKKAIGCPVQLTEPLAAFRSGLGAYATAIKSKVTLDKPSPPAPQGDPPAPEPPIEPPVEPPQSGTGDGGDKP